MKVLFSSYHNYLDTTSGAAVSTRSALLALRKRGAEVRTVCGCFFDSNRYNLTRFLEQCYDIDKDLRIENFKIVFDGVVKNIVS